MKMIKVIRNILLGIILIYLLIAIIVTVSIIYIPSNFSTDIFTITQTTTELILIPIAIIGFYLTYTQLKKQQQTAELELFWNNNGENVTSYQMPRPGSINIVTKPLLLVNHGNSPAIHYQIKITYPNEFGRIRMKDGWESSSHEKQIFRFGNPESLISFPDTKIDVGTINFSDGENIPDNLEIPYEIYSDKGPHKKGKLIARFIRSEN
jgi:hypothetical protein